MKEKILKIFKDHLKTYAEVGGYISKGIPQYKLEDIAYEIIDEINREIIKNQDKC